MFSQYYEDLATPKDMNYDIVFLDLCNLRCADAEADITHNTKSEAVILITYRRL